MRFLEGNTHGDFSLTKYFVGDNIPEYAILSHTWGTDTEEVTYRDLMDGTGKNKTGYQKIRFCGKQAGQDHIQYFWVDTCCIDKTNSTELAEAINSMFRWYRDAAKCYVYLSDVTGSTSDTNSKSRLLPWEQAFRDSKWFTRGWTLQELIAPISVEFFSRDEKRLGDKKTLKRQIHEITGILISALKEAPMSQFGVDERLSWAENRQTTRGEDKAYSLLGIFDVFMPLIYGEGQSNAMRRLRKELREFASTEPQSTSQTLLDGTALLEAASTGEAIQVEHLLEKGAHADSKDMYNQTPLLCAAKEGYETVVKLLLATGKVEVDSKDRDGKTPLSWAAANGHEGIIKLLLETGEVDVDSKDKDNQTPLLLATKGGYETVVELLLTTREVEVDSTDRWRRTPLSWAAAYGYEGIVKLLLETGKANANSKGGGGNTPLMWAIEHNHEAIVNLLQSSVVTL